MGRPRAIFTGEYTVSTMSAMPPDHQASRSIEELLPKLRRELKFLRRQAGEPSTRDIAKLTSPAISHTTVNAVLHCDKVPRWNQLEAVVTALGGNPGDFRNLWVESLNAVDPLEAMAVTAPEVQAPQEGQSGNGTRRDPAPAIYGIDLCLCLETGSSTDHGIGELVLCGWVWR
jgi:hypothetical protein